MLFWGARHAKAKIDGKKLFSQSRRLSLKADALLSMLTFITNHI